MINDLLFQSSFLRLIKINVKRIFHKNVIIKPRKSEFEM